MTWEEAMTQAHEEVVDNLENLGEMDRYCSGWRRRADTIGFYKQYEIIEGGVIHVEIDMTTRTITYAMRGGR